MKKYAGILLLFMVLICNVAQARVDEQIFELSTLSGSSTGARKSVASETVDPRAMRENAISLDLVGLAQATSRLKLASADPVLLRVRFFYDEQWLVELHSIERTYSGGVAYVGKVAGVTNSAVVMVDNAGTVSMQFSAFSQAFSITGTPQTGYSAKQLGQQDRRDHPREPTVIDAPANDVPQAAMSRGADPVEIARDDGTSVDVMVVYTPAARIQNGGTPQIQANIDAQVALTNTIYANSNVVQRVRLVYRGEVPYVEVNMNTDLPRLALTADGFMDNVPVLRDIYRADIVSLWGVYIDYCGLGYLMGTESAGFASSAYNIVASPGCTGAGSYTFAHEMGHNMGLRHDNYVDAATTTVTPEAGGAATTIQYAKGYVDLVNRFRTVMAYNDQCSTSGFNCTRIPHFSNPSVSYNNNVSYAPAVLATTGNATNAHERQALNDTRDTTSNFRQALASFTGPGLITFMAPSASVGEGGGSIQIAVERHLGSTGTVSVSFATSNGTATGGADFTSTSGTFTWADGDITARTITIPILQDAVLEGKETFSVTLSAPAGGATLGSLSTFTVTIADDEPDSFPLTSALPSGFTSPNNPPVPAQANTPTTVWSFEPNDGYLSSTSLRSAQVYSASGDFTNYRNSDMEFTGVFAAGNITFAYRVSSYSFNSNHYGFLEFMVDDVVVFSSEGGETGWQTVTRAVTAGTHTLRWRFKNRLPFPCANANPAPPGGSACADRAWVDSIVLPLVLPLVTTTTVTSSLNPVPINSSVTFTATSRPTTLSNISADYTLGLGGAAGQTRAVRFQLSGATFGSVPTLAGVTNPASLAGGGGATLVLGGTGAAFAVFQITPNAEVQQTDVIRLSMPTINVTPSAGSVTLTYSIHEFVIEAANNTSVLATRGPTALGTPLTGTVAFRSAGNLIGGCTAVTVVSGSATCTTSFGSGGTYAITADYSGDANYASSTGTLAGGQVVTSTIVPGSPTGVTASAGPGSGVVTVSFTAPASNGGAAITSYTASCAASGQTTRTNTGSGSPIAVSGLTNGVAYTCTVTATNSVGSGSASAASSAVTPAAPAKPYDLNGDGKPDLIWRHSTNGNTFFWYMNGAVFASDAFFVSVPPSWEVVGVADFNGDGKNDVVWRNTANGDLYVWYLNNGVFVSDAFLGNVPPPWKIQGIADFNGDGKPDLLWRNAVSGNAFIWYMNNTTFIADQLLFSIDPVWSVEAVADLNADGKPDLVFRNTVSGLSFVWNTTSTGNVTSLTTSAFIYGIAPVWEVVQIADYNGDNKPDFVFRNASTGLVFVWYADGTTLQGSAFITQIDPVWEIVPRP
ncbi:MAG: VCBS repeat-containing protein [Rhodocyclaceae bacterium]|nr:VCBS repeat-containing protein [Rhodocyclaceae bacterium]MCA3038969.1 VCBS repeat-containing protein [Rhodocyclaceae bacterium]MCA3047579.1 VCBS repeat-containing protein [Rhodocyclaceae bacterium]MCA3050774.1 VCBS repeat-containing protein [Rhodocyclaceae bacterium]MCA3056661.1 VCBS repeat-containing protein [Rhodocyclaceae bacterium]